MGYKLGDKVKFYTSWKKERERVKMVEKKGRLAEVKF